MDFCLNKAGVQQKIYFCTTIFCKRFCTDFVKKFLKSNMVFLFIRFGLILFVFFVIIMNFYLHELTVLLFFCIFI